MINNLQSIEFRQSQQTILLNVTFALWLIVVIRKEKKRKEKKRKEKKKVFYLDIQSCIKSA